MAPAAPVTVPMTWLLANAPPPLQYRSLGEIGGLPLAAPEFRTIPYASREGWHILMLQESDGTWPGGMLGVPQGDDLQGLGTIVAFRRLIELGWDPESPALTCTKRLLFRLLAEDEDASLLAEMREGATDEDLVRRGRHILREAAAAALAQAGYEGDPRLRGAARRLTDRVGAYLKSPLASKPWIRVGNQHVLPPEAHAPSFHTLVMLAHMPHFRSEHHEVIDRLFTYLSLAWPRQQAVQQVGAHTLDQPQLVLGDFLPTRNAMDADMPSSLAWLELMARLGYLRRHEGWTRLLDRLLDDRDRKGVWHPPRSVVMPAQIPAWSWPTMPAPYGASDPEQALAATSVEVTFRLGLIARLAGRPVDLV